MIKICTSIEQSKKLLSLGLDPNTADMHYEDCTETFKLHASPSEYGYEYNIPAWSLAALLELVPVCIKDDNYFFVIEKYATYLDESIWRVSYKHFSKEDAIVERHAPLINAAFEMVCWLIEQGHIKVNK